MKYQTKKWMNVGTIGLGLGMVLGSVGAVTAITALMATGLVLAGVGGGAVLGFGIKGMIEEKHAKQERKKKDFYVEHSFDKEYEQIKGKQNQSLKTYDVKKQKTTNQQKSTTDDFEL